MQQEEHFQHDLVKKLGNFEEYIHWRCKNEVVYQKDFIYSKDNELLLDFVGRFENLESDFSKICSKLNISATLPKLNVSNKEPYQSFYTESSQKLVEETFKPDIELFGYEF